MCIYCGTANYRKIYASHFGPIPLDEFGRSYEIHHIDGNRKNNDINNLKCVSIQEHYDIHYAQGDYNACMRMSHRMKISTREKSILSTMINLILMSESKHHFLDSEWQSNHVSKRVNDGTHHFVGDTNPGKIKSRDGSHHFFGGEIQHNTQKRLAALGLNNFQNQPNPNSIKVTCQHCDKTGSKPGMVKYHFDNCKFNPNRIIKLILCIHCNKEFEESPAFRRHHLDKCKFKCD